MRTKSEEKRQTILETAAAAFGELGFERTSMSEICARVGGSKATLYNYFPSKEALFVEVMFQASEADFQNTMGALQANNGEDVAQTLRTFGRRFLTLLYSPPVVAVRRLLVAEGERSQIGINCYERGPRRGNALISQFLQASMAQGRLRAAQPELMTRHWLALLEAEVLDRFMFQHKALPCAEEIGQCTERAVDAFMRLYAP